MLLDAIEQIQVSLAPYDVRQGGFTGAGINAVTKSGTNDFKGTAYTYFRNESLIGKKIQGATIENPILKFNQTGSAFGGPIVKNKLFFFTNAEITRQTDPGQTFRPAASAAEAQAAQNGQLNGVSRVQQSDLQAIRDRLVSAYGCDPGAFQDFIQFRNLPHHLQAGRHPVGQLCDAWGIERRFTKPAHPWTNGQVERMNRTLKEATIKRFHYETTDQPNTHLQAFLLAYNFAKRLKRLKGLTPYEFICTEWRKSPTVFHRDPADLTPGPYN